MRNLRHAQSAAEYRTAPNGHKRFVLRRRYTREGAVVVRYGVFELLELHARACARAVTKGRSCFSCHCAALVGAFAMQMKMPTRAVRMHTRERARTAHAHARVSTRPHAPDAHAVGWQACCFQPFPMQSMRSMPVGDMNRGSQGWRGSRA